MILAILLTVLWLMVLFYGVSSFMTLCKTVRFRDVATHLDVERIAPLPFQPRISLVVRCNLNKSTGIIEKIQKLLALNYNQFELIVIMNASKNPETFENIIRFFEMKQVAIPGKLQELSFPTQAFYRSCNSLYGRLSIVDKKFRGYDDVRVTGAAVCKADFMLWVKTIDNDLTRNSLARMAIMVMRDPENGVVRVRAAARYHYENSIRKDFFRIMSDLCNMRRLYVGGAFSGNDFGQYLFLDKISAEKGRKEFIPMPQMYLHRKNNFKTYLAQLNPDLRFLSAKGRVFAALELVIALLFWGAGLYTLFFSYRYKDLFLPSVLMLPLLGSTFSIFVGEIWLKRKYRIDWIFWALLISWLECIVFCLAKPWVWLVNLLIRREK